MKLNIARAPITPDADAALDRLLYELLINTVKSGLARGDLEREAVSPTGTDRDQGQTDDLKMLDGDGAVDAKNSGFVVQNPKYNKKRSPTG